MFLPSLILIFNPPKTSFNSVVSLTALTLIPQRCGFNAVLLSCRGVVRVDINLQDVDIDQCSADGWFAETHRCNTTTMEVSVLQKSEL